MYCPTHFQQNQPELLLGLIEAFPFATVVANGPSGLVADHLPVFHRPVPNGWGQLMGHVAKNNPLWRCAPEQELLLIFQGPSTYISPQWYASKPIDGKVVPTWNYAVVHVYATLKALHAPDEILKIVTQLTQQHEAAQAQPWQVSDAPADFTQKLLAGIVGVEFSIQRIQGKWKASQNQSASNQGSVVEGLLQQGTAPALQMAELVKKSLGAR